MRGVAALMRRMSRGGGRDVTAAATRARAAGDTSAALTASNVLVSCVSLQCLVYYIAFLE